MSFKMKWDDKKIIQVTGKITRKNMRKTVLFVASDVQRSMKTGGLRDNVHSKPGQVPFVQLGFLKDHIGSYVLREKGRIIGVIGVKQGIPTSGSGSSKGGYAKELELGTSRMKPRPYLVPGIKRNQKRIGRMLVTGR